MYIVSVYKALKWAAAGLIQKIKVEIKAFFRQFKDRILKEYITSIDNIYIIAYNIIFITKIASILSMSNAFTIGNESIDNNFGKKGKNAWFFSYL